MGLVMDEIKELRSMNKEVVAKTISAKDVQSRVSIYSQTEKRIKHLISKEGKSSKNASADFKDL